MAQQTAQESRTVRRATRQVKGETKKPKPTAKTNFFHKFFLWHNVWSSTFQMPAGWDRSLILSGASSFILELRGWRRSAATAL